MKIDAPFFTLPAICAIALTSSSPNLTSWLLEYKKSKQGMQLTPIMKTETAKGHGTKNEGEGFGCCNPENFKEMFEKMSKCFPGQDGPVDFSAMKDGMMQRMMGMCCLLKTTDTKEDAKLQKEKEGETESTEKKGCTS